MLLFDATHTSHTRAQTGIQRVTRSLFSELAKIQAVTGICHDPYLDAWRALQPGELAHLRPEQPGAGSRASLWSLRQRLSGHAGRLLGGRPRIPTGTGLVCPEFFGAKVGSRLPEIFPAVSGPRVAVFYDAIPLQFPELTPPRTVARFPAYLRELLLFDGVAAISATSAAVLRDYWQWLGVTDHPPVEAIPLAISRRDQGADAGPSAPATGRPRLLCVCTIEGRKNHLALLAACAALWAEGLEFELQLIGLARPDTASAALEEIRKLQAAGRPLLYRGSATDAALNTAYRQCAFTVYPSYIEGFGLPVLESLGFGKPCVCAANGAIGESARDGGCVTVDPVDAAGLAAAIRRLLVHPTELAALTAAARQRNLKTWRTYAGELHGWMQSLRRRS